MDADSVVVKAEFSTWMAAENSICIHGLYIPLSSHIAVDPLWATCTSWWSTNWYEYSREYSSTGIVLPVVLVSLYVLHHCWRLRKRTSRELIQAPRWILHKPSRKVRNPPFLHYFLHRTCTSTQYHGTLNPEQAHRTSIYFVRRMLPGVWKTFSTSCTVVVFFSSLSEHHQRRSNSWV